MTLSFARWLVAGTMLAATGVPGLAAEHVSATRGPAAPQAEAAPERPKTPRPRPEERGSAPDFEGTMTLKRMAAIIVRLDAAAKTSRKGVWRFVIEKTRVIVITDETHDRMRILVPIRPADALSSAQLLRMMQANFDTALDSRYAIARNILWATYIHPLRALHDRQFISAIGQTVNIALTFGTTYSSGQLSFGGGDSRDILRRQLIERLLKKGQPI